MTLKQEIFVKEYLVDLNATQAAIRAGYSAKTAGVIGPRLLGNVSVAEAINEAIEKRGKKLEIDSERVLAQLGAIGFADIPIDIENAKLLQVKRAALVDIGRHLGMFTDKHEITGKDGGPVAHSHNTPLIDYAKIPTRELERLEAELIALSQTPASTTSELTDRV